MRKVFFSTALMGLLWLGGCSSDDEEGGPGPGPAISTVTANTSVNSPSLTNANDAVWNGVTAVGIDVSGNNAPKQSTSKSTAVADSVYVQAIKKNDSLFLRLRWKDTSMSVWRDNYKIIDIGPPLTFEHNLLLDEEDQVFVLFDGGSQFGWDVWNWRVLTTGAGGLAEGMKYLSLALTVDAGGAFVAAGNSPPFPGVAQPTYVHNDTSEFNGYVLPLDSIANFLEDTTIYGTNISQSTGWSVGQRVPGWIIDRNLQNASDLQRNSRFDIRAVSEYNDAADMYTAVLASPLNTGYADDIDFSALGSVVFKVGLYDNQADFGLGSSNRGYTGNINLVLP